MATSSYGWTVIMGNRDALGLTNQTDETPLEAMCVISLCYLYPKMDMDLFNCW